jgi:hypothetical protein
MIFALGFWPNISQASAAPPSYQRTSVASASWPRSRSNMARAPRQVIRIGAYIEAGATIADHLAIVSSARVILGVRAPSDLSSFQPGTLVVSPGGRDEDVARASAGALRRTTRAHAMNVLSSQATIAGSAAVIEGARVLDVLLPMLTRHHRDG